MAENTPLKRKAATEDEKSVSTKRLKSDYTDVLSVVVGEEGKQKTFMVYKDLINQKSKFFKAATTSSRWIEAIDKTVKLPEHAPSIFKMYLDALHNPGGELMVLVDPERAASEEWSLQQACDLNLEFVKAWLLGDYLDDVDFKNRTMRALLQTRRVGGIHAQVLTLVEEKSNPRSTLYHWVVESMYRFLSGRRPEMTESISKLMPAEFNRQLLLRSLRHSTVPPERMIPADSQDFFELEDAASA